MNAADSVLDPARVEQHPQRAALSCGAESISYAELLARVNRFGNGFLALGLAPENRVLMMLNDTPDMVAAYLGALKIGAVPVALNVRASREELLFAVDDSRARVFLLDAEFLPAWEQIAKRVMHPVRVFVAGNPVHGTAELGSIPAGQADALDAVDMSPDDMAFWLYTSGTTGTPKAAVHLQHDVLSCADFLVPVLGLSEGDRVFSTSKLFFAYALGASLFATLRAGATAILHPAWPDSASIAQVAGRHRPTLFFSVPTLYRNLLRDGVATRERFESVRHFISAGERLPVPLYERWREATGRPILDAIGSTETIYFFLANRPDALRPGSAGKPAPGVEVELRDEQGGPVSAPGAAGTLWVAMPSNADRYWNQQARSRAAFVGPWFRTGDVFRCDADGYWHHEGRADDMLRISSQWVSPAEIEEEVLKLPEVAEAAVVGVEDADGLTRLALFAVPADKSARRDELARHIEAALAGRLSIYKCPRRIHLLDEIPRTATGKVQRYRLREQAQGLARTP